MDVTERTWLAGCVQMSNTSSCAETSSLTLILKQHTLTFHCKRNLMHLLASLCPSKTSENWSTIIFINSVVVMTDDLIILFI